MVNTSRECFIIDIRLRFALFGLECALGVPLSGLECERIFKDAENDQCSAKDYVLGTFPDLLVTGHVDEYEAETIWLTAQGRNVPADLMQKLREGAEYHVFRLQSADDERA